MIQTGDFVKLHYTGKLSDGTVFDTTREEVAKAAGIEGTRGYHAATVCVGQRMVITGLDDALIGRTGTFSVTLQPDAAFGRKDAKLLKIVPTNQLLKQQIRPRPGMRLNIDGQYGVVRTASPDRTVVDFNHPLASQEVTYDVEILEIVSDPAAQVKAIIDPVSLPYEAVIVDGKNVTIKVPVLYPPQIQQAVTDRITRLTSITTVSFEQGTRPAQPAAKRQTQHPTAAHDATKTE
jgi:FKBP-type peptidyl-prolyl cis-trans isomerase SlyD